MNDITEVTGIRPSLLSASRRTILEERLDRAVERAQKHYLKVNEMKSVKPNANAKHLGRKLDVLA